MSLSIGSGTESLGKTALKYRRKGKMRSETGGEKKATFHIMGIWFLLHMTPGFSAYLGISIFCRTDQKRSPYTLSAISLKS